MGIPRRIDRYDVIAPLAKSASAIVYRARASAPLSPAGAPVPPASLPHVALKVLGDASAQAPLFQQRLRVATSLTHENIVRTFGGGTFEGQPYLVMELVEGLSLAQVMAALQEQSAQLPLEVALYIALELCAALHYAHRHSGAAMMMALVHGGISPGNVLLASDGMVKLGDFGAGGRPPAQVASAAESQRLREKLTYMAPEQVNGAEEPRSDLYSLAALLYEIVCGQPIRHGATLDSVRLARLPKSPGTLRAMPRQLDALLLRCLSPNPVRRPPTAADLRGHLQMLLKHVLGAAAGDPLQRGRAALAELVQRLLAVDDDIEELEEIEPAEPPTPALQSISSAEVVTARVTKSPPPPAKEALPSQAPAAKGGSARRAAKSDARGERMSPKKLRLLVAASALLFLLAGAAIGTMLGMQGDDGAKGPPPMTERDAMVPGYARRVPVLKLRRFDAGVKKD